MVVHRVAIHDDRLTARVVWSESLHYAEGADRKVDRPSHVRSGSGLAFVGGDELVVVQDDASFLAWVNCESGETRSTTLDYAPRGARQFDDTRGNKGDKLDLESCLVVPCEGGVRKLLAFGSGSTAARTRVIVVDALDGDRKARIVDAKRLYDAFAAERSFSGSELNIEGVALIDDAAVRFFQRGNGAPTKDMQAVDASADVELDALLSFLESPESAAVPTLSSIETFDLGKLDGVRLTFTDAAVRDGCVFFLAAAEASPDAVQDGPVAGVVLGCISKTVVRWTRVLARDGSPFLGKAEGLAFDPADPSRAWIVIDRDDPNAAAELCALTLEGPWPHAIKTAPPTFPPRT